MGLGCTLTLSRVNVGYVGVGREEADVRYVLGILQRSSMPTGYAYFCKTCSYPPHQNQKQNNSLPWLLVLIHCNVVRWRFGILQARSMKWVAIPFSRGSSPPRDWTHISPALQVDSLLSEPPGKPSGYIVAFSSRTRGRWSKGRGLTWAKAWKSDTLCLRDGQWRVWWEQVRSGECGWGAQKDTFL